MPGYVAHDFAGLTHEVQRTEDYESASTILIQLGKPAVRVVGFTNLHDLKRETRCLSRGLRRFESVDPDIGRARGRATVLIHEKADAGDTRRGFLQQLDPLARK